MGINTNEAKKYFEQGCMKMCSLIDNRHKYENAFSFSVHAYVNMSMKYYQILGEKPGKLEWVKIKNSVWELVERIKFSDKIIDDLVNNFVEYAAEIGYTEDVKGLKRKLATKERRLVEASDYEIDELPNLASGF